MEFEIATTQRERSWILSVRGEIDLDTGPAFEAALMAIVEFVSHTIVVDLTETVFVDSTALNILGRAHRQLEETGGQICIVASNRNITVVFRITGLDRVFPIYATVELALSGARATEPSSEAGGDLLRPPAVAVPRAL